MSGQSVSFSASSANIPDSIANKVRVTPGHTHQVLINSKGANRGNAYDFSFNAGFDSESFSRLIPTSVSAHLSIPNINVNNNQIIFTFSLTPGVQRIIIIPQGYYTAADFFTLLAVEMTVFGGPFASVYHPNLQTYTITSAGDTFRFENCTMATGGVYTMDLPILGAYQAAQIIHNAPMFYTPLIYVQASRLVPTDGNLSYSAGSKIDHFTSIYLEYPDIRQFTLGAASGQYSNAQYTTRSDKSSSSFAVRLLDAFGEPLSAYCPVYTSDFFLMNVSLVD